jgi:hypothetical protein
MVNVHCTQSSDKMSEHSEGIAVIRKVRKLIFNFLLRVATLFMQRCGYGRFVRILLFKSSNPPQEILIQK